MATYNCGFMFPGKIHGPKRYESMGRGETEYVILRSCWTCLPDMAKLGKAVGTNPFSFIKRQPVFAQALRVVTFRVNRHNKKRGVQPDPQKVYFASGLAGKRSRD